MSPKAKVLLTVALILSGWIIGFVMGGRFSGRALGAGDSVGEASAVVKTGEGSGMEQRAVVGKSSESAMVRRLPWDRERVVRVVANLAREGNIANFFRHSIQVMDQWEASDFPMVMQTMEGEGRHRGMEEMLGLFAVARWAELDAKAAADFLVKNKKIGGWIDFNGPLLWSIWGTNEPAAAVAYAKTMEDASLRENALKHIVESLARADPDNALTFAKIHAPDLLLKGEFSRALGTEADSGDPERTARRLTSLEASDASTSNAIGEAAALWAKHDRIAALAWAQSLASPSARAGAIKGVYQQWFEIAPKEAAAAALAEPRGGADFGEIGALGVNTWPSGDWAGAAVWAGQLPTEKERIAAYGALGGRLGKDDSKAGAKWLETLPIGSGRDEAIAGYVLQSRGWDGAVRAGIEEGPSAIEWALAISDATKRKESAQTVVKHWFDRAPAEAFEWLQNSPSLTPEQKQEILRK